ncbi:class I SAM-dependent DNA methyltransferase [Litorivicinus lipolyticus]
MTDSWNDLAADRDDNPSVLLFADNAYRSLREAVDLRGRRILDFGCGTGLLSARMAPDASQIVALDPSAAMASRVRAKQLSKVQVRESVLDPQAPMLAEPFDLVVASSALGFVEDVSATLNTIRQLLRPGGTLVHWDWCQTDGAVGPGLIGGG